MTIGKLARRGAPLALLAAALALSACITVPLTQPRRSRLMALETLVPARSVWTTDKVLLVGLHGVLSASPGSGGLLSEPSSLVKLKDALQRAEEDPSIRAVLLRIDSPGGSVTASDLIHQEILSFKRRTGRPVVAVCMGVAASGGYYAAVAADAVYVHPTTLTGSIGVIGLFPNLAGLTGKIGVDVRVVKSGEFKDVGSMWRAFGDGDRAILQNVIDTLYERFLTVVSEGRPQLDEAAVRRLADGRIYTAREAVDLGLADGIGYLDDAFAHTRRIAGLGDAALVAYRRPGQYIGHYYAETGSPAPRAGDGWTGTGDAPSAPAGGPAPVPAPAEVHLFDLNLGGAWSGLPKAEGPFYYLWMP